FRFKRPGATAVSAIPASDADPSGQNGTVFYGESDTGGKGIAWGGPFLVPNEGAIVSFNLPPSSQGPLLHGMPDMKWTVAPTSSAARIPFRKPIYRMTEALKSFAGPTAAQLAEEPEGKLGRQVALMPPEKRQDLEKSARAPAARARPRVRLVPTV